MRILHVFRTPVGGLFRHVRDAARKQAELGHDVGLLCDSATGGVVAEDLLNGLMPHCSLGIERLPMSRLPGLSDDSATRCAVAHVRRTSPHIIHCHGAKGGLYGRAAAWYAGIPSVYAPHGGSLHYSWASPAGAAYLSAEKALARLGTGGLHFVCQHERDAYHAIIGIGRAPSEVIYNGLWPEDFAHARDERDAADLLFLGDMRTLKGVDVLLDALAILNAQRRTTACLAGDGPDLGRFRARAYALGLEHVVSFPGRMPALDAFARGRILVMPSLAESFPYVVLEACAAGLPILASAVGGIPEVLHPDCLVVPGQAKALAERLSSALANAGMLASAAEASRARIMQDFTVEKMTKSLLAFYGRLR